MGRNKQTEAERQLFQSIGKRISQLFEKYDPAASNYDLYRIIYGEEPTTKDNGKNKISALRNGRNITLPVLMAISNRYHVSIDWLVHGHDIKSQGCTVRDVCNAIAAMSDAVDLNSISCEHFYFDGEGILLQITPKYISTETGSDGKTLSTGDVVWRRGEPLSLAGEKMLLKNKQGVDIIKFLKAYTNKLETYSAAYIRGEPVDNNKHKQELHTLVDMQPSTLIEKEVPKVIKKEEIGKSNYTVEEVGIL